MSEQQHNTTRFARKLAYARNLQLTARTFAKSVPHAHGQGYWQAKLQEATELVEDILDNSFAYTNR